MTFRSSRYTLLAALLLLGGCSYADDLFGTHMSSSNKPSSTPAGQTTVYQIPASSAEFERSADAEFGPEQRANQ